MPKMFFTEDKPVKKKILSVEQALVKGRAFCAYQERYQQEVRDKLYEWGLHKADVENVIVKLIEENFLNEERFAKTFAGGKFRIKKWGRVKIKLELKQRGISDYCIRKGLAEIPDTDYNDVLEYVISKKAKDIRGKIDFKKNYKLAQYVISRGFESEMVWQKLKKV